MRDSAAIRALAICLTGIVLLTACSRQSEVDLPVLEDYYINTPQAYKTDLKLGVVTGPYGGMFNDIIEPLLAQKGYSVEIVTYENYNDPNFALAKGEIDLNIFQHYKYLNNFKFEHDLDLSPIAEVPTAAMGVYSYKYSSLDEIEHGAKVAVPSDSTNLSRTLVVLSTSGIITVDPAIDNSKLTLSHVIQNNKSLEFVPVDAHLLINALGEYDLAVINGNFAISGGFDLSSAIYNETVTSHEYINVVAVRTEDLNSRFVADLMDVLRSDIYKNSIMRQGGKYSNYQFPCNFDINVT